jgi:nucleoside-diphosphate-sugar epimerase
MNWDGKRVLVTGAEGFIGSHLVKRLLKEGASVHALVKKGSSLWRIQDSIDRMLIVESDITDPDALKSVIPPSNPQIVFHLAALVDVSRSWELMLPLAETNILGTLHLLLALRDCRLDAFIHTGSSEEYGDAPSPITETQRESPISPYSFSKVAGTHLCRMAAKTFELPVTVVRLFPTYGPFQDGSMFIPSAIRDLLSRKEFKMSPGEQIREFTYVDDVVDAYLAVAACAGARGEILNVGCGMPYRLRDVAALIGDLVGGQGTVRIGALPYRHGEGMVCYCSSRKMRELTGWSPKVPLEQGLRATINWYASHRDHPVDAGGSIQEDSDTR